MKVLGQDAASSFAPPGLVLFSPFHPRLAPWAVVFRRFAALGDCGRLLYAFKGIEPSAATCGGSFALKRLVTRWLEMLSVGAGLNSEKKKQAAQGEALSGLVGEVLRGGGKTVYIEGFWPTAGAG